MNVLAINILYHNAGTGMRAHLPAHAMHVCWYMHTAFVQPHANITDVLSITKSEAPIFQHGFGTSCACVSAFVLHVLASVPMALFDHAFLM